MNEYTSAGRSQSELSLISYPPTGSYCCSSAGSGQSSPSLIQTRKIIPLTVMLVGEGYWCKAFDIDFLADKGVVDIENGALSGILK
jgi:hypothetical protein